MGDFIGFTYNNIHSSELGIYRTSNGNRYDDNITATMNDKVVEVPGGDGQYYFGTTFTNKKFNISFAFNDLTEGQILVIKNTFCGDGIHDLIFDEAPYKVWSAKVTGSAVLKHLCFNEQNEDGQTVRKYRGEGSIEFTCYYPYAHTPDITKSGGDGRFLSSYSLSDYPNKNEWPAGILLNEDQELDDTCYNIGDIPAPFIYTLPSSLSKGDKITLGRHAVVLQKDCPNGITWDSKKGIVTTKTAEGVKIVPCSGNVAATLDVGERAKISIPQEEYLFSGDYQLTTNNMDFLPIRFRIKINPDMDVISIVNQFYGKGGNVKLRCIIQPWVGDVASSSLEAALITKTEEYWTGPNGPFNVAINVSNIKETDLLVSYCLLKGELGLMGSSGDSEEKNECSIEGCWVMFKELTPIKNYISPSIRYYESGENVKYNFWYR